MKKAIPNGQSRPSLRAIPAQIKILAQWMPYKLELRPNNPHKMSKVPKNQFGVTASKLNKENWMSFDECLSLYESDKTNFSGIGFCPNNPDLLFIDLDDCFHPDGSLDTRAREIVDGIEGYVERSQSGSGLHIVTLTDKVYGNPKSPDGKVEIFTDRMYLAMTGDVFEGRDSIPDSPPGTVALDKHLVRIESAKPIDDFEIYNKRDRNLTIEKAREILLNKIIPNPSREDWLLVGRALHFQFEGDYDALMVWDEYSTRDGAGNYQSIADIEKHWNGLELSHPNPITFASIYHRLKKPELTEDEVIADNPPVRYSTDKPKAVRYLLNGFMAEGVTSIAGAGGAGKTTMVVELASIVAHLCDEETIGADKHFLKVRGRRRVIHFAEDTDQVERALYAKRHYGKGASSITRGDDDANDWYTVIQTKKYTDKELGKLITAYSKKYTENWPGDKLDIDGKQLYVEMPPLLIFDTASATFDLLDENSNSEQSKMIAAIKMAIRDIKSSIWIITHVAKAARAMDVTQQTSRGAGAIEADVQTAASLAREIGAECSVLSINKNRIQTEFNELAYYPSFNKTFVQDEWGDVQEITYITGEVAKGKSSERISGKKDAKKISKQNERDAEVDKLIVKAFKLVAMAPEEVLYGKTCLRDLLGVSAATSQAVLSRLFADGYLVNRNLTPEEREKFCGKRAGLFVAKDLLAERDFEVESSDE